MQIKNSQMVEDLVQLARITRSQYREGLKLYCKDKVVFVSNPAQADVAIVCVGLGHGGPLGEGDHEGSDKRHFDLPAKQIALIKNTLKRNPKTIVISINGSPYGMEAFIDQVPVFVEAWYGGAELGNVVASILFGGVNPSGKIPITFPKRLNDVPAHKNRNTFPGKGQVHYDEGIYVGYRHFDTTWNFTPISIRIWFILYKVFFPKPFTETETMIAD